MPIVIEDEGATSQVTGIGPGASVGSVVIPATANRRVIVAAELEADVNFDFLSVDLAGTDFFTLVPGGTILTGAGTFRNRTSFYELLEADITMTGTQNINVSYTGGPTTRALTSYVWFLSNASQDPLTVESGSGESVTTVQAGSALTVTDGGIVLVGGANGAGTVLDHPAGYAEPMDVTVGTAQFGAASLAIGANGTEQPSYGTTPAANRLQLLATFVPEYAPPPSVSSRRGGPTGEMTIA